MSGQRRGMRPPNDSEPLWAKGTSLLVKGGAEGNPGASHLGVGMAPPSRPGKDSHRAIQVDKRLRCLQDHHRKGADTTPL